MMTDSTRPRWRRIFLHGQESSGQGYKARLLRGHFPTLLTPDFSGTLDERMQQLDPILSADDAAGWLIVGSSFGGLMGALWTCAHPQRVGKLVLLAPALNLAPFGDAPPAPVDVPVVIYHGRQDSVVPLEPVRALADAVFPNLTFHSVDDEHRLQATVPTIDWPTLLAEPAT